MKPALFYRGKVAGLLAACALSTSALAAERTDLYRMTSGNAATLGIPKEGQGLYNEWRRAATRYAELLAANKDARDTIGRELDLPGMRCVLEKKIADFARATLREMHARKQTPPTWLHGAVGKAQQRAEKACSDRDDGEGGQRAQNLGALYLVVASRVNVEGDAQLISELARIGALLEEFSGMANGRVAPAASSLPIFDPRLFLRRANDPLIGDGA